MTGADPQAPVDSSPTVDVESEAGADDYRLDLNARARWVATRACRSRAAYAVGHGYEEVHYVLRDLAVILGPTDARTDGDGKLVLEAVQVSRVADACDWLAVHARDNDLADDAALVACALRDAVNVDVAAEEGVEAEEEPQVLPDGGQSSVETGRDKLIQRLRSALHSEIEIVTERADVIEGPGGTQLVNGRTHDVETWIDRRSRWGNPFKTKDDGGDYRRYESVELYRGWFHGHVKTGEWDPEVLRGDVLGCWCLPEMCHGVVVMNHLAETYSPQQKLVTDGGQSVDGIERGEVDYRLVKELPEKQRADYVAVTMGEKTRKQQARNRDVGYGTVASNIRQAKENLHNLKQERVSQRTGRKFSCSVCGAPLPEDDTVTAALWHTLETHSEHLAQLLNEKVLVRRECSECGYSHDANVRVSGEDIYVDAVCPDCEADNPYLTIMKGQLSPDELLTAETTLMQSGNERSERGARDV